MASIELPPTPGIRAGLLAALSLAERAARLRGATPRPGAPRGDSRRAAALADRWRSRPPFDGGGTLFDRRLRLDGLTEEGLRSLLALSPASFAKEAEDAEEGWVRELEALYLAPPARDADPELARRLERGTNGFLWLAEPLMAEGLRRFRDALAQRAPAGAPYDLASAEQLMLPDLLDGLARALELTIVLELNVARVKGLLAGSTPQERFAAFCHRLRDPEIRRALVREYPVLFRSLNEKTAQWVDASVELLLRLGADWDAIRATFAEGADPGRLATVRVGAGDPHRRGRSVAILGFERGLRVVYKPRSLAADVGFGELLAWIGASGFDLGLRAPRAIDRGDHGWAEFVEHAPCASRDEVERFYRRLGGYLAALRVVQARDMHFENLLAAGEHPVAVDLETLFHAEPAGTGNDDPAIRAFQSSVMQVMLLPQPVPGAGADEVVDLSGLGASSAQPFPLARTSAWERPATDEMRVGHATTAPRMDARNRPRLDGREVDPADHAEAFVAGFRAVYRIVEAGRDALLAPGGILERLADAEVRFVARPTAAYAVLLRPTHHPDLLRDGVEWDRNLDGLWIGAAQQPHLERLVPAETRDLRAGDVPAFTARPGSRDLWASDGEHIPDFFEQPALERVRELVRAMGDADLARQEELVRTAIAPAAGSGAGPAAPPLRKLDFRGSPDALALARAVGDLVCRAALENERCASWIGITALSSEGHASIHPLDPGLYDGLSGCALFLAYLASVTGDASYERIARKATALVRRHLDRGRASGPPVAGLGAFTGLGGIVYALAHLGVLWDEPSLLAEARALADDVPALVGEDATLDLVGGSAGAIAALEVLHRVAPGDALLRAAIACGEHLLARQRPEARGAAWTTDVASTRPLTGFSHGAAGIAWALQKLGAWSGEARFGAAAREAIAYERSVFDAARGNWPDFRARPDGAAEPGFEVAWCHGAPGIALARLDGLRHLDDAATRAELAVALGTTAAAAPGRNHGLCHGELGNLDVLLHAAALDPDAWGAAARERAGRTVAELATEGIRCGGTALAPPGLMTGLAGVGHGLLRLARPERVPSVLVLAPPVG